MSHDTYSPFRSATGGDLSSGSDELEFDAVFDALSHPHRRRALSYLVEAGEPVPLDDLYDAVARGAGDGASVLDSVEATFHHWHRPKLEAAALIEAADGVVSATDAAADLWPHLDLTA